MKAAKVKAAETKTVYVHQCATFSTSVPRVMKITLPRMPWEAKEEVKEAA